MALYRRFQFASARYHAVLCMGKADSSSKGSRSRTVFGKVSCERSGQIKTSRTMQHLQHFRLASHAICSSRVPQYSCNSAL